MKKYDIWIGYYPAEQDSVQITKPIKVATVEATTFRIACTLFELRKMLNDIEIRMVKGEYIDEQSCRWFYDFDTNSNSWTGKYFETEKDALDSFNIKLKK